MTDEDEEISGCGKGSRGRDIGRDVKKSGEPFLSTQLTDTASLLHSLKQFLLPSPPPWLDVKGSSGCYSIGSTADVLFATPVLQRQPNKRLQF